MLLSDTRSAILETRVYRFTCYSYCIMSVPTLSSPLSLALARYDFLSCLYNYAKSTFIKGLHRIEANPFS